MPLSLERERFCFMVQVVKEESVVRYLVMLLNRLPVANVEL